MVSILDEIRKIRGEAPIIIDYGNKNRYRVVINENDGSKTAYYFTAPIYNIKTNRAVDMKFHMTDDEFYAIGSNTHTIISNRILMENTEGYCSISLNQPINYISDRELASGNDRIYPTTNGIMYKAFCPGMDILTFDMEVGKSFSEIRENDRCISLMNQRFRPFVTISCIGTANESGKIIAPAKIAYQRLTDTKYRLKIRSGTSRGVWVMFEANLYEDKLVQDTTVESANPKTNNAFGTSAFIGNTEHYGEQWLYSKMDFQKLADLMDKEISKVIMHIPEYESIDVGLDAFKVMSRFCSFGSNWHNKIAGAGMISRSQHRDGYSDIDITKLLIAPNGRLVHSDGIIIRPQERGPGAVTIATGDSYYRPQIFEVNFK